MAPRFAPVVPGAQRRVPGDGSVTLVALAGLLLWEALRLDRWAAHRFGNAHGFALRDTWFTSRVMHDGGRLFGLSVLRPHRPALARAWLTRVLALGFGFGWAQLARGAHYPSHTLRTAWLCWRVCVAVARVPEGSMPAARLA